MSEFPFAPDDTATPQLMRDCMVTIARRTGAYRGAAYEVGQLLDRLCGNNAEKLCALAYVLGCVAGKQAPGMRDLLLLAMPLIARELVGQD